MSGISCSEYGEVEQAAVNEAMWVILTGLKSISQHTCADVAVTPPTDDDDDHYGDSGYSSTYDYGGYGNDGYGYNPDDADFSNEPYYYSGPAPGGGRRRLSDVEDVDGTAAAPTASISGEEEVVEAEASNDYGARRRRLLTDTVNIGLDVTVRDAAFGELHKVEIIQSVQDRLAGSVASGNLTTLIAAAAAALDSSSPLLTVIISETLAPTALPTPAPTSAPTTVWVALGGRHLALVLIGAALAVVMCGCVAAFIRSLVRHRRQAKEQNATARDVPVMSREMSALVLEEPTAPRAPETSGLADVAVDIAVQESEGRDEQESAPHAEVPASEPKPIDAEVWASLPDDIKAEQLAMGRAPPSNAAAAPQGGAPTTEEWTCERCTFLNTSDGACEMCGESKPRGASGSISPAYPPSRDPLGRSALNVREPNAVKMDGEDDAMRSEDSTLTSRPADPSADEPASEFEDAARGSSESPAMPQDKPSSPTPRPKNRVSI